MNSYAINAILSAIYIIIFSFVFGIPFGYIKWIEKMDPTTDAQEKNAAWMKHYLHAFHNKLSGLLVLIWAVAIFFPMKWFYSLFVSTPLPISDLTVWGMISVCATSLIIMSVKLNWPEEPSEIKDESCDCSLNDETQIIGIKLTCLPEIKSKDVKSSALLPSIPYESVGEDRYSDEFSNTISDFSDETFWRTAIQNYIDNNSNPHSKDVDKMFEGLPRLFLVCNFTPLQIIGSTFGTALNPTKLYHDQVTYILEDPDTGSDYKTVREAINGNWKNADHITKKISPGIRTAYPHFNKIRSIHYELISTLSKLDLTENQRAFFHIYEQTAIARILIWKKENGILWPGRNNYEQTEDVKLKRAAFEIFRDINGIHELEDGDIFVPCYVAFGICQ